MMLAHIFGIPVEETLLPWISSGAGAATLMLFGSAVLPRFIQKK
jgi:hypothetical protein